MKNNKAGINTLLLKIKDNRDAESNSHNSTFELYQTTPKIDITSSLSSHKEKYPHISKHLPHGASSNNTKGSEFIEEELKQPSEAERRLFIVLPVVRRKTKTH